MDSDRLRFAMQNAGLVLPEDGTIALWNWGVDQDNGFVSKHQMAAIHRFYPQNAAWAARGVQTSVQADGRYSASILSLPRVRDFAQDLIARACAVTDGPVILTGAKTEGIDSMIKAVSGKVTLLGKVSKAHGKCVWFTATSAFEDWVRPVQSKTESGHMVSPGVFSADGPDPASVALAEVFPNDLKGHFADLGAGWGWLSQQILARPAVKSLHLVEADHAALDCAKANVPDARAQFHWNDATTWTAPGKLDGVIMNPPFHIGRKADPGLGRAFIASASRILAPHGSLWMVANRHLPYEQTLSNCFKIVTEIDGNAKFKLVHAQRPIPQRS